MALRTTYLRAANPLSDPDTYITWDSWQAAEQEDLATNGNNHKLWVGSDYIGIEGGKTLNNWGSNATNYIDIEGEIAARAIDEGAYLSATGGTALTVSAPYTKIRSFGIRQSSSNNNRRGLRVDATANDVEVRECWFRATGKTLNTTVALEVIGTNLIVVNSLIVGVGAATGGMIVEVQSGATGSKWYNCTVTTSGSYGIDATATVAEMYNCALYGAATANFTGTVTAGSNNAGTDTTIPGTSPLTNRPTTDMIGYDVGTYNIGQFSALYGAGVDKSSVTTIDIRTKTRSGWSIGAYKLDVMTSIIGTGGYSTVAAWDAAEATDLPTEGECHEAYVTAGTYLISGSGLDLAASWVGDGGCNLHIQNADGAHHQGVRDAGAIFESQGTAINDEVIVSLPNFSRLSGFTLKHLTTYNVYGRCIGAFTAVLVDGIVISEMIFDGGQRALFMNGYNTNITLPAKFQNIMIYGGIGNAGTAGEQIILNNITCTADAIINIRNNARAVSTEVINLHCASMTLTDLGSYATKLTNSTVDGTAVGTGSITGVSLTAGDNFTDPANDDWSLVSGGVSGLDTLGTDLSAAFDTDVTGATR